jgi:hypothetical protein
MLTTDGLQDKIEVLNVQELYAAALNLFHAYNPSKDLHLLRTLGQMSITTSEFCQIIGRMRLYQALTPNQQKRLPRLLLQLAGHLFLMQTLKVQETALLVGNCSICLMVV